MKLDNQYSNQWYEALARDLKSGAKAPEAPFVPPVSSAAVTPDVTPIDFSDGLAGDGFVDIPETPAEPVAESQSKKKSKKKKKSDPLTNVILALSICIFLGSAGFLVYKYVYEPYQLSHSTKDVVDTDDENNVQAAEGGIWESNNSGEEERNADGILKKYEKALAQNSDMVGFIQVPNTPIEYCVTQTTNNDYYLKYTFDKKYNAAGNPFLDCNNVVGPNGELSKCSVIYGHHRRNGTMFAKLKNYDDVEFYKQNPVIKFDTIYDPGEWVVFADFRATTNSTTGKIFEYRKFEFKDDKAFMDFVTAIQKRSYFTTPVEVNADDQILLLSTCAYEKQYWRLVIAARKVREGETIDVRTAEKNVNLLWP